MLWLFELGCALKSFVKMTTVEETSAKGNAKTTLNFVDKQVGCFSCGGVLIIDYNHAIIDRKF